jgi:hypothetical protein
MLNQYYLRAQFPCLLTFYSWMIHMVFIYDNFIYLFVSCLIKLHPMYREKCCTWFLCAFYAWLGNMKQMAGRRRRDRTCSCIYNYLCYHHERCEFEYHPGELYSMQHYVIKFACDFRKYDFWQIILRVKQHSVIT